MFMCVDISFSWTISLLFFLGRSCVQLSPFFSCFIEHVFYFFLHSPHPFSHGNFRERESGHGTRWSFILWMEDVVLLSSSVES
jgi:hypothetical protein